jgi:hypothetical protein
MEKKNIVNPFAQKGRIITGNAFIGRYENLESVANNVTKQSSPNNLAIIGYPRIGKSSLAKQSIIEHRIELIKENKIPIWIDFSKFSNRDSFFKYLVRYSFDELKKLAITDTDVSFYAKEVSVQENWDDLTYTIEKYFEYTVSLGFYFIFILDEFDEARSIFNNSPEAFKTLRQLAYDSSKYGVAIVTTSRRSIKEIEVKSDCSSSTFNLLFTKEYLRTYDKTEIEAYFQLYENVGISMNNVQKSKILYYCGGHPFLLAFLGFEIVELYRADQSTGNIDVIFNKIHLSVSEYYEQLIDLLKEDNTFEKMLQILFGPMLNVTDDDIKELRDVYGLLEEVSLPEGDKGLLAFSQHFQEYLSNIGRKIDFWPLWVNLETTMREVISKVMENKFGNTWLTELENTFPTHFIGDVATAKEGAIAKRNKAKEDNKSNNLLDYLDAYPLFEIVLSKKCWNDFKDIFGGDKMKAEFEKKIQLIVKIRNPYAHSRFNAINPTTVQQAEIYCKDILDKLNLYLKE